jgi:MFS family permease
MPQFLHRFTRVSERASGAGFWKGLLTATIELGALIEVLNRGWITDRISRKYSIVVAVGFFIVGSALPTGAVDYALLTTARLIGGIGIGMLSMVVPLYISEIVPPEIRGSLLVLEEFAIVAGIAVAFWISYGTRFMDGEWAWRLPFLLQIVLGLVLGAGILLLPFSLRWLVSKGRHEEPKRNLVKLRSAPENNERLKLELLDIQAEVAFHQEVSRERHPNLQDESKSSSFKVEIVAWKDCFKRGCWRRTHVRMGLMFFQQVGAT